MITSPQQAAWYSARKRNRLGRPPLDSAPLDSSGAVGNWGGASSGGDRNSYKAKGVHFDGTTWLVNATLACVDGPYTAFSFWGKSSDWITGTPTVWVVNPNGDVSTSPYNNFFYGVGTSPPNGEPAGSLACVLSDAVRDPGGGPNFYFEGRTDIVPTGAWEFFLVASKTNLDSPHKQMVIYRGQTNVVTLLSGRDGTFLLNGPYINGHDFWIGNDDFGDVFTGDMADFQFRTNVPLLDGGGNIPLATLRLFIDANGKPVDPAVATAALGAPPILLSGNHSTFGTNQGTGGTFVITGALTNASTSPSD